MKHQKPHFPHANGVLRLPQKTLEDEQVPKTLFNLPMPRVGSKKDRIHKDMPSY